MNSLHASRPQLLTRMFFSGIFSYSSNLNFVLTFVYGSFTAFKDRFIYTILLIPTRTLEDIFEKVLKASEEGGFLLYLT